jgi:predicted ATP-grasp superfamily ATP-dependent carboligase
MIHKTNISFIGLLTAISFLSIFLVLGGALPSRADIYKYEDADGVIHLTNVPSNPKAK